MSLLFYNIRGTRRIGRYLSLAVGKTTAPTVSAAMIFFHNIGPKHVSRVQHCFAGVVTRSLRFSQSSPFQKYLHWLPVRYSMFFKMCTLIYQALSSTQPSYLGPTFAAYSCEKTDSVIELRSSFSLKKYRIRLVSVAGPTLW